MCLHPRSVDRVPQETARVAKAAFRKGTVSMSMSDELGAIFEDEDFVHLFALQRAFICRPSARVFRHFKSLFLLDGRGEPLGDWTGPWS
jgi:hypothetical protein